MLNFCDFIQFYVFTRNHHLNRNVNFIPLFILRRKRESEIEANDYLPLNRAYKVSPTKVYELPQCTVDGQLVCASEDNHPHVHAALILPYI